MELSDVVRSRRMVRSYDPGAPVPAEVVHRLVDAAARAPSAGNAQGLDLVVLRTAADRDLFWAVTAGAPGAEPGAGPGPGADDWLAGMRTAPLLVVVVTDPGAYARRYAAPDKARAAAEQAAAEQAAAQPGAAGGTPAAGGAAAPAAWWDVDAGMAAVLLLLTAVDAGLGACFFGVPPQRHEAVRAALGVPQDRRLVGVVSVGTPAPHPTRRGGGARSPHRPARRGAAEVGHDGRFGKPLTPTVPGR